MHVTLTRRNFIKTAAAVSAVPQKLLAGVTSNELRRELPYSAVQLTGGPLQRQYEAIRTHYLAFDNDRLLKVYRQRAGLPAPGANMGGWYDLDGFVPGHALGQYISGLARVGASTGDPACHQKVHDLVAGFAATLGSDNQSILRPESNPWVCYTLDKHFIGLIDSYSLSNVIESKDLLTRFLNGARPLLPTKGHDRIGKKSPPYDETYVMPENLFSAYDLTGNPAFRELGLRYLLDRELFDPLARGEDPFPGQHAYSHVMALSSAGKAYLALGDAKYLKAMQQAFMLLTTEQQFASGGWGPNETFITPHHGELYDSLSTTVDHFETPCGAYAATKLARYLLRTTPDPRLRVMYADYLERVLYNTILAVRFPHDDGDFPYYSTYSPYATKVFYPKKWPCCSGTLVQTVADYPLNICMQSSEGIDVNLYIPTQVTWKHGSTNVTLTQLTGYPAEDSIAITLRPERPLDLTVNLRVPSWASAPAQVTLAGKRIASGTPGSWIALSRTWHSGDTIVLTIPQDFRTEAIDDKHPETVALMRGPVQYVAVHPSADIRRERLKLPGNLRATGSETYIENYAGKQAIFVPLHRIQTETYTSYFTRA
jgi:DUF1680 family protein